MASRDRFIDTPFPSSVFPIAATTVTDDFHRADENPIGAPWRFPFGIDAQLLNNKFSSIDRTGYWEGDSVYGTESYERVEAIMEIDTDISLLTNPSAGIYLKTETPTGNVGSIEMRANIVVFNSFLPGAPAQAITNSVGDQIGIQAIGSTISGWYKSVGGTWQEIGTASAFNSEFSPATYPSVVEIYLYADDGPIAISEFRIAEVGQIITPPPRIRSRRTSW